MRNRLTTVSASRGDVDLNLHLSGTVFINFDPSSIPIFLRQIKKQPSLKLVMFLAENLKTLLSASIAFVWTNTEWVKPKPLYKQKERTKRLIADELLQNVQTAQKRDSW